MDPWFLTGPVLCIQDFQYKRLFRSKLTHIPTRYQTKMSRIYNRPVKKPYINLNTVGVFKRSNDRPGKPAEKTGRQKPKTALFPKTIQQIFVDPFE